MDGIALEHLGATTVLRCNRPITYKSRQEFMNLISALAQRPETEKLLFVFSHDAELDATGIGVLTQMHAIMVGSSKRLYLCMPPPHVVEQLKELNLFNFLRILTTEEEVLMRLPD
ncbi:MAG: STAS domain-containing protein [Desulfovibrionaceae bacterium]|nr:STAS domain-containing protein [Desulfovibrionaceae bacterium]